METDEQTLAERACAGDQAALSTLLARTLPQVRSGLGPSVPDRWRALLSADDVAQAAATDAIVGIGTFRWRGEGSFAAWLVTLARNNLLNAVRGLEAEKRGGDRRQLAPGGGATVDRGSCARLLDELVAEGSVAASTPSRAVARDEAIESLARAIESLPDQYGAVVRLYDLEGARAETVAATLGRSVGAMFMLRARAHRALAERMGSVSQYLSRP